MDWFADGEISGQFANRMLIDEELHKMGKALLFFFIDVSGTHAHIVGILIVLAVLIVWFVRRYHIKYNRVIMILFLPTLIFLGLELDAGDRIDWSPPDAFQSDASSVLPPVGASLNEAQRKMLLLNSNNKTFFDKMIISYGLVGSGRGYIYLRALNERLKNDVLLGTGPDTFAIFFPRNDEYRLFGGCPDTLLIDKIHSLYLQIWFNTGLIAFGSFMLLLLLHFINTVRIFWKLRAQSPIEVLGLSFFLGWTGFLGTAIFNDSAISVSPYFWAVFGASIAANHALQFPIPIAVHDSDKKAVTKKKKK